MKVLNYSIVAILLLLVAVSGYSLLGSYFVKSSTITVDSIDSDAKCGPLKTGDVIFSIGAKPIKSLNDYLAAISSVKSGDYVAMVVNGGPGNCKAVADSNLGFSVKETAIGGIKFGPDVTTSDSYIYSLDSPNSTTLAKTKKIINNRINFYDFPYSAAEIVGDKIKITTPFDDELPVLVSRGKLRAAVQENFKLDQGAAKVIVGDNAYIIKPKNDTISINSTDVPASKPFELSNITFNFLNASGPSINLQAELFGEQDVVVNPTSQIVVTADPNSGLYFYYIGVSITPDANQRFTDIIRKAESAFSPGGTSILNARLVYYIDNQTVSSLAIPVSLIGNDIKAISGIEKTSEEAYRVGGIVYTSLRFGSLPSDLKFESRISSPPAVDKPISYATLGAGAAISLGILAYIYVKTKKPKVVFWIFALVLLELLVSAGLLVAVPKYLGVRLLIDYPVLIGLSLLAVYSTLTFFTFFEGLEGRHKHIIVGYKKVISWTNLLRIVLLGTIVVGIIGFRGMSFVLLVGFLVDALLLKQLFKTLTTNKN